MGILADYDSEQVTVTLTGVKSGDVIEPKQFGPDERYNQTGRTWSSTLEGQGGTVIRNVFHPAATTFTITLMSTDPASATLSKNCKIGERYTLEVVDHNGTAYVSGRCWVQEEPAWQRAREATPYVWTFGVAIDDLSHGQTTIA